jgi:hypothetical protein
MTDSTVTADREQLFAKLADPATTGKFFERVSDSVSWTVMGTHPLARLCIQSPDCNVLPRI